MQGLCASQHCGEGLEGNPGDVIQGLLLGKGAATGLCMKAQHHCLGVCGTKRLHGFCPNLSCCPEFCHFLKKIVVGIEKEGKSFAKGIDVNSFFNSGLYIGLSIAQCKGDFLCSRAASLPDMVP